MIGNLRQELLLERALDAVKPRWRGRVETVAGLLVEAEGVPCAVGELCVIDRGLHGPLEAEVVGFRGSRTLLMPLGDSEGIAPMQRVSALGKRFEVPVSLELLGRTVDGFARPLDDGPAIPRSELRPARDQAPGPLERREIDDPLETGVRAVDGLCTIGRGQRLGLFAGSGVGKSTLLGQITRNTSADVVICCLVGERGREVGTFRNEVLEQRENSNAVLVVATSDRPPIERYLAPFTAVAMGEWFRDQGLDVLLVMDSVTRFAAAVREIGLAAGEPPTTRGYPPSFFATLPKLIERMGRTATGSLTGLLTVLVEGDDTNEPVSDTLRGLLDGHMVLSREIADSGQFPAIDVLQSLSRLMPRLVDEPQVQLAQAVRADLAAYRDGRDLVDVGAYRPGMNPELDAALMRLPGIKTFLAQGTHERSNMAETRAGLASIFSPAGGLL